MFRRMHRTLLVAIAVAALLGCKGGDRYKELAKKAKAARADAGEKVVAAPTEATRVAHQFTAAHFRDRVYEALDVRAASVAC